MDSTTYWISKRSIGIAFIVAAALSIASFGTGNLALTDPQATSPESQGLALQHVPTGKADLQWNAATHTLVVTISAVSGLTPNSTYPAAIQQDPTNSMDSCSNSNHGKTVYDLNTIKTDKFGNATSVMTTLPNVLNSIPDQGWYLAILNGSQVPATFQQERIACGNIVPGGIPHGFAPPGPNDVLPSSTNTSTTKDQSVHTDLMGSADHNQRVIGHASLSLNNGALTVIFSLGNFAPNSKHAAQIHQGTCEAQGPIVFPLNDVNVDEHGQGSSTTTVQPVSAPSLNKLPWYITVYEAPSKNDLNGQTGVDLIACGDFSQIYSDPQPPISK